jgi:hypothetical protein
MESVLIIALFPYLFVFLAQVCADKYEFLTLFIF